MLNSPSRTDRKQQTIKLPDGRMLGYAEFGATNGTPLLYFHGWPSSRIEFGGLGGDAIAQQIQTSA